MKPVLFALLILAVPAFARLGETPAECTARYGTPIQTDKERQTLGFEKGGLFIMAEFFAGRCTSISFQKVEKDPAGNSLPFTAEEVELLRAANSGGLKWIIPISRPPDTFLWTVQGEHRYTIWPSIEKNLVKIATKEHLDRADAARASEQKEKFKGF